MEKAISNKLSNGVPPSEARGPYSQRSYQKEFLDRDDIPFTDIQRNMRELEFINTYLGGHSITISGFKKLARDKKSVSVCEIGCGGGDNLNAISKWCFKKKVFANFIGIDINASCIAYAQSKCPVQNVNFITSDYRSVKFNRDKPG